MTKLSILLVTVMLGANIYAQMPQGGGFGGNRGGQGGRRGGPPTGARGNFNPQNVDETPVLEYFPEIPFLTLEQRVDIGLILGEEQKVILKQEAQKRKLFEQERASKNWDKKKIEKNRIKIAQIDKKIQRQIEQSNRKIAKKLSGEQYRIFLEKRNEFKFSSRRPPMAPPREQGPPNGRGGTPPRR